MNHGSDLVITREGSGMTQWWFTRRYSMGSYQKNGAMTFGRSTDKKLMGDFNGDAVTDFVAVRPENGQLTWWIVDIYGSVLGVAPFGLETDTPIVGDYDGDGMADMAVTRVEPGGQKTWHINGSKIGYYTRQWGVDGDTEIIGDYDGDGKTDVAVVRTTGTDLVWYILRSNGLSLMTRTLGKVGDIPQVGDVDKDGKSDMVVFRSSTQTEPANTLGYWFVVRSSQLTPGIQMLKFGAAGDVPQMGDHDGDGQSDFGVFRGGTWWMAPSYNTQYRVAAFGWPTDKPMSDFNIANSFMD